MPSASRLGAGRARPAERDELGAGDRRAAVAPSPQRIAEEQSRPCGRHGGGPGRRCPGRDRSGDLASHADLRIRPHPLCLRAAHGPGSRRRVRHLPLAVGSVSAAGIAVAGQEDRGRGRGVGRGLLPGPVGRQRANPALVPDDRRGAVRRDRRPQPVLSAPARMVGAGGDRAAAGERAWRLVPAFVRGRAGADGGLRGLAVPEPAQTRGRSAGPLGAVWALFRRRLGDDTCGQRRHDAAGGVPFPDDPDLRRPRQPIGGPADQLSRHAGGDGRHAADAAGPRGPVLPCHGLGLRGRARDRPHRRGPARRLDPRHPVAGRGPRPPVPSAAYGWRCGSSRGAGWAWCRARMALVLSRSAAPPTSWSTARWIWRRYAARTAQVMLLAWHRDRLVRDSLAAQPRASRRRCRRRSRAWAAERGVTCDEVGCVVEIEGLRVGLAHAVEAAVEDCGRLDLVIARAGPEFCKGGRMIGPRALRASGGIAVKGRDGRLEVETVRDSRGDWPWTRMTPVIQTYKLNLVE